MRSALHLGTLHLTERCTTAVSCLGPHGNVSLPQTCKLPVRHLWTHAGLCNCFSVAASLACCSIPGLTLFLLIREQKLDIKEQVVSEHQAEAVALKAELQSLADTMRTQTEKQATESAEDKQAISRHQARLDTLQVCYLQPHVHLTYMSAALTQMLFVL